jgi:Fe-S cluster biogenesis protein NfuA
MQLREFVRDWISECKEILLKSQDVIPVDLESPEIPELKESEYDEKITALLDQYVRPAVANDGGAIDYVGYDDGKVVVTMKGSCAGCPSSTATLKGGIETLLKQHLPNVQEVVALNQSI